MGLFGIIWVVFNNAVGFNNMHAWNQIFDESLPNRSLVKRKREEHTTGLNGTCLRIGQEGAVFDVELSSLTKCEFVAVLINFFKLYETNVRIINHI